MRIFVYEFVTGGGAWSSEGPLPDSLITEGEAMLRAVAADFAALLAVQVVTTRDARLPSLSTGIDVTRVASSDQEQAALAQLAQAADWTLLIAPETDGALLDRAQLVEKVGGRLISPSSGAIRVASSKHDTLQRLAAAGIQVPGGALLTPSSDETSKTWQFPLILKPDGGCGACGVRLIRCADELRHSTDHSRTHCMRAEQFVSGLAASVAVLCGPGGLHPLTACEQVLSADGLFRYLGGRLPLAPELNCRAQQLALNSVAALPQPQGYVGVDLILGEADDGSADYVIEINPRLTTSYVGLRALARCNLAAAMLDVARGNVPDLSFGDEQLEFRADGVVSPIPSSLSAAV
jgi:predicted ATP-grasp superfamily ATP-dependent carboligase